MDRGLCLTCLRPPTNCYCKTIHPFESHPHFVILIHPKEFRKAINTGKMAHNILSNSLAFVGSDFSQHSALNKVLEKKECFLLFPGDTATDLADIPKVDCASDNPPVFIILDATWPMAKKMLAESPNLQALPQVSFQAGFLSQYTIRRQPRSHCLSTIETIFHIIDRLNPTCKHHLGLLEVFHNMVRQQIMYEESPRIGNLSWNRRD